MTSGGVGGGNRGTGISGLSWVAVCYVVLFLVVGRLDSASIDVVIDPALNFIWTPLIITSAVVAMKITPRTHELNEEIRELGLVEIV